MGIGETTTTPEGMKAGKCNTEAQQGDGQTCPAMRRSTSRAAPGDGGQLQNEG
jgi:hypothetical protein